MKLTVTGKVIARVEGSKQTYVIVDDGEDAVALKFWGRTSSQASGVHVGQTVRAEGRLKSREWQGKYFTDIDVEKLVISADGVDRDRPAPPRQREPGDDDVPF